eukprot:4695251-Pyramimonas_sp.AAC.1
MGGCRPPIGGSAGPQDWTAYWAEHAKRKTTGPGGSLTGGKARKARSAGAGERGDPRSGIETRGAS